MKSLKVKVPVSVVLTLEVDYTTTPRSKERFDYDLDVHEVNLVELSVDGQDDDFPDNFSFSRFLDNDEFKEKLLTRVDRVVATQQ